MIREHADVAVLGAGFAGSLMALILQRLGRRPLLLERGTHPRFAIGESSTPYANLVLEELSRTYDLPRLWPFTEYGRWQQSYPHIAVGLKRGFSFYQHEPGQPFRPTAGHARELLVAASPHDEVGDTHWFRQEFDHFLVQEVQKSGIPYFDHTHITDVTHQDYWKLRGRRGEEAVEIDAAFLIDATGPSGLLTRQFGIDTTPVGLGTHSWSVYSHFVGVERWEDLLRQTHPRMDDHPYRCDDAALHHILPDGWIWVLRFNNGVTSAGVVYDGTRHAAQPALPPEVEWQQLLTRYPSIGRQFAAARAIQPWVRTGRLQRRAAQVAGPGWAMLPHAAYFLDPLFSTGIAHTMLGIERLARLLDRPRGQPVPVEALAEYQRVLFREIEFVDWLVHGCFRTFARFELLASYTMYYFVGAHKSETRRRRHLDSAGAQILFSHCESFRAAVERTYHFLIDSSEDILDAAERDLALHARVAADIAPYNLVGFCDAAKQHMYPWQEEG
jgi:FADH2 O2-dependent halogenase